MKKRLLYLFLLFAGTLGAQTIQWTEVSLNGDDANSAIKVYETYDEYNGRIFSAKYVEVDLSNNEVKFQCKKSDPYLQPLDDFEQEENMHTYVSMNGGYFGGSDSYSHVAHNGQLVAPNFRSLTRTCAVDNETYSYPVTRGTLGLSAEGHLSGGWVYTPFVANDTYLYDEPLKQSLNNLPLEAPLKEDGTLWNMDEAIGGGPLLVRYDSVVHSKESNYELFYNDIITGYAPRTAIGYRDSVTLIMLVVDGRQTSHSMGCSMDELAEIMLNLGCETALNLDGGGSSAIQINGALANSPSDGNVRSVATAVMITSTTQRNRSFVAPKVEGAETSPDGAVIQVNFDKVMAETTAFSTDGWTVMIDDVASTVTKVYPAQSGSDIINIDIETAASFGQIVSVAYDGSGDVMSFEEMLVEAFEAIDVFNAVGAAFPAAENLIVEGTLNVDETVTAAYTFTDVNGDLEGETKFQWYVATDANGSDKLKILGERSREYSISENVNGKYIAVQVTPFALTGGADFLEGNPTMSTFIAVSPRVGVQDQVWRTKVYPNPMKNELKIESTSAIKSVSVMSLLGCTLSSLAVKEGSYSASIQVSNFPPGVYLVQIIDKNGEIDTQRIVKR